MATNYKEWISDRAEELAQERYNKGYYDLPENIQMEVWQRAEADYTDHKAARIDAAYERWLDDQIIQADQG
jgi:hypothetical protein